MRDDPDLPFAPSAGAPSADGPLPGYEDFSDLVADLDGPTAKVVPELWLAPQREERVDDDDPTVAVPGVCSVLARQLLVPIPPRSPSARRVIVAPLGPPRPPSSTRTIAAKIQLPGVPAARPPTPAPAPPPRSWRFTIAAASAILALGGLAWYLGSLPG